MPIKIGNVFPVHPSEPSITETTNLLALSPTLSQFSTCRSGKMALNLITSGASLVFQSAWATPPGVVISEFLCTCANTNHRKIQDIKTKMLATKSASVACLVVILSSLYATCLCLKNKHNKLI